MKKEEALFIGFIGFVLGAVYGGYLVMVSITTQCNDSGKFNLRITGEYRCEPVLGEDK